MKSFLTMKHLPKHSDKGFTLIETMIGLAVFSIGILAVCTMTVVAINAYNTARTNTTQVNRTTANTEALKQVAYENSYVFSAVGTNTSVQGDEGAVMSYSDTDGVVVSGTKLIVMQNNKIKGGSGNYTLYYIKPIIQ